MWHPLAATTHPHSGREKGVTRKFFVSPMVFDLFSILVSIPDQCVIVWGTSIGIVMVLDVLLIAGPDCLDEGQPMVVVHRFPGRARERLLGRLLLRLLLPSNVDGNT